MTYSLTGVVVHTRISETCGHYRAFVRSTKDSTQWFSVDDLKVHGLCMVSTYFGIHAAQPSLTSFATHAGNPVSVATVLLQEPFMLFYQAQEGIHMVATWFSM